MSEIIVNTIQLNNVKVSLLAHDIIKIEVVENIEMDANDVMDIQKCKQQLIGDKKHTVLFISPQMGVMNAGAKELASSEMANKNAIAKAIVLKNLGIRILSSFFIKIYKPKAEHKLFLSEEDAIRWLHEKMQAKS